MSLETGNLMKAKDDGYERVSDVKNISTWRTIPQRKIGFQYTSDRGQTVADTTGER